LSFGVESSLDIIQKKQLWLRFVEEGCKQREYDQGAFARQSGPQALRTQHIELDLVPPVSAPNRMGGTLAVDGDDLVFIASDLRTSGSDAPDRRHHPLKVRGEPGHVLWTSDQHVGDDAGYTLPVPPDFGASIFAVGRPSAFTRIDAQHSGPRDGFAKQSKQFRRLVIIEGVERWLVVLVQVVLFRPPKSLYGGRSR
jgi:hypothetical protein